MQVAIGNSAEIYKMLLFKIENFANKLIFAIKTLAF